MIDFRIRIAGHNALVQVKHIRPFAFCRDFITDQPAEFCIRITQQDIDKEKEQYEENQGECSLWDNSLEFLALQRLVADKLLEHNVFLMHGAVIAYNNEAYMFTASSGAGKTTHIMKWLSKLPNSFIVNGDKPFIRFDDDAILACGSPWAGKEALYTNTMVPLKSIILMERAEENHMEQISFAQAFPGLLQQVYRPNDEEKMRKTLRLMQRLNGTVSFWRFQCNNFKDDCFDVAYKALVRDQG